MSNRQFVIYEADPTAPGGKRMFGLDPSKATGIPLPAFSSGPTTPAVGTVAGEAFLNTTTGSAFIWNGTRWNPIVPTSIVTYPRDSDVISDNTATKGTYAFSESTGNFFVRFDQAGTLKWRQIGTSHYATQAGMLADTPADGTFAYAQDTNLFFCYKGGVWHPESELLMDEANLLTTSPGVAGQRGVATDTGRNFTWSGTAWLGDPFRTYPTQAQLLADNTPAVGTIATSQDTNNIFMKNSGGGWTGMNVVGSAPVGEIIMFPSLTPPSNFLLCDGSTFSATTFPQLATILGGNTLPDLRGQFVRGASATRAPLSREAQATARPTTPFTTDTTGNHTHVLWQRRMSNYSGHGYSSVPQTASEGINAGGAVTVDGRYMNADGNHSHTITGGGDTETRPANIALAFHIRATL